MHTLLTSRKGAKKRGHNRIGGNACTYLKKGSEEEGNMGIGEMHENARGMQENIQTLLKKKRKRGRRKEGKRTIILKSNSLNHTSS